MAVAGPLAEAATKAFAAHCIGSGSPPKAAELWEQFRACAAAERCQLSIENRFFAGFDHTELDWSRPVHGVFVDFKGDSMQLGMLLQRLEQKGEQYVFVGGSNPAFNGGWHFTAVNDFERPAEQASLDPSWRDIRVWTRVNYVASVDEAGEPALTPAAAFRIDNKHAGALPVAKHFKLTNLYFTGGLMPHTLNATAVADNGPMARVIAMHLELGATLLAIGHGLDVLLACGTTERPLIDGFDAAIFPKQDHLAEISGLRPSSDHVCRSAGPTGATLVSASCWGPPSAEAWLEAAGLGGPLAEGVADSKRFHSVKTIEPVVHLDVGAMAGMEGAVFKSCAAGTEPLVAVFVDDVADPIEIYTIVSHLMGERLGFQLVSHSNSGASGEGDQLRKVVTETVFGNAMYGLRDCACILPTTPASVALASGSRFDSFFVAGGQCPYQMMEDPAMRAIMDEAEVAAAVCHGPEALIGSKWMRLGGSACGRFTAYYGCWVSFRDVLDRFERKKPGEVCQDDRCRLFSGNAPNATKEMTRQACEAIRRLRGAALPSDP